MLSLSYSLLRNSSEPYWIQNKRHLLGLICEVTLSLALVTIGALGMHSLLPCSISTAHALFGTGVALLIATGILAALREITFSKHRSHRSTDYEFDTLPPELESVLMLQSPNASFGHFVGEDSPFK